MSGRSLAQLIAGLSICIQPIAVQAQGIRDGIDDQMISRAIQNEFWEARAVDANDIDVSVADGIVILRGTVDNIIAKERAVRISKLTRGVASVVDELSVSATGRSDVEIHTDVIEALAKDPATDSWEIAATVMNGTVTLTGTVDSFTERTLVGKVAKAVRGVRALSNEVDVNRRMDRPDSEIRADVRQVIDWDVRLDDDFIEVDVQDGDVTLTGSVNSVFEHDHATGLAWVAGVNSVDAENLDLRWSVNDELEPRRMWQVATDDEIESAVRRAMLYDARVRSFNVDVETSDGIVTLSGVVDNLKAKHAAAQAASNTIGVRRVDSLIKVRPFMMLSDTQIAADVRAALMRDAIVDYSRITVDVTNGEAQLYGFVDSEFERRHAEDIAARINGVTSVDNQLDTFYWSPRVSYLYEDWDPLMYDFDDGYRAAREKPDAEIVDDIESELFWSPFVDAGNVDVEVDDGVATLTGAVGGHYERRLAAENALQGGAYRVENELIVASSN